MKRKQVSILLLIIVFLLSACSQDVQQEPQENDISEQPMEESQPAVVSGACGVSYFPILPDTTWVYRMKDETGLFVETRVWYEEITEDSFVWNQEMESDPPVTARSVWTCSDEGLVSTDFATTNVPAVLDAMGYDYEYEIETLKFSGITFPSDEQWVVGSQWTGSWQVTSDVTVEDVGLVNAVIDVTMDNTIAAEEPITVPAGSYEKAMRVDSIMSLSISLEMEGMTIPTIKGEYTTSSWYVQGVGLVKQSSEDTTYLMELGSME